MCEMILVKVQCATVKLLTIFHNKKLYKMCKSNIKKKYCCSITSRRAVTRVLNLVTLQCVTVKVLSILLVTFFAFRTLQTVP